MSNRTLQDIDRRLRAIERKMPRIRRGVVSNSSPLSVKLGGSDAAYSDLPQLAGSHPAPGDSVAALTTGHDAAVLGVLKGGLVSTLPTSPELGTEVFYYAPQNRTWHLVADGDPYGSGCPWAVLGGAPLLSRAAGGPIGPGGNSLALVTAPLTMIAVVRFGASYTQQTESNILTSLTLTLRDNGGAVESSIALSAQQWTGSPIGNEVELAIAKEQQFTMTWEPTSGGGWQVGSAYLEVTPVRVA
jgi:hypothetical protein